MTSRRCGLLLFLSLATGPACRSGAPVSPPPPGPSRLVSPPAADAGAEPDRPLELTVAQAVSEALQNNRTVRAARANVAIARTRAREALAALLPQISGTASYFVRDEQNRALLEPLGISFPVGPVDVFRFDVQADFPVYAFGRHLNSHRAAKLDHRRAEADRDATESDVAAEVTAAAFDLLETIAQIDVARSNEEALQRTVADATAQQDAGRVTRAAVLEAQVEHAAARRRRERLESLVRIRRIVLNALLGRPTDDATVLIDDRVTRPPSFDEQALLAEALRNRPEVRSAELAVRRSRRTLESVVGSELPELRGSVGYHTDDNEFIDQSDFGFFELTLTLPIFRAGARRARIRRARREVDLAGLRLADTVAEVRTDVAASYRDVVETYADIGVARQSVERSAESLRIQREKFGAGRATSREVLDSTALLNQARFAEVQAIYDYKEALQRLHRARGADPRRPPRASDGPK